VYNFKRINLKELDLKKFDRYIIRKFIGTFFFMVLIIMLIIVVIDVAEKIDAYIDKKISFDEIVWMHYANFVPWLANKLSPICVFLAVIFFTSRLAQDTEIVAILSSGVSFYRLMVPYIVTAVWISYLSFYLNAFIVPHAYEKELQFDHLYFKNNQAYNNKNIHKKVDQTSFIYLYSYNQAEKQGYLFTLEERDSTNRLKRKVDAQTLQWVDSSRKWRLSQVRERMIFGDREVLRNRSQFDTTLRIAPNDIFIRENQAQSMALDELYAYIQLERERGSDFLHQLNLERAERYAYPVAAVILTLMGYALSTQKRRGGIALQIGFGLVLTFGFVLLINVAKVAIGDYLPAWVAVWLPNVIYAGIVVLLIRVAPK